MSDCLNLNASNSLDPIMLSLVMEHLLKSSEKRNFTAEDLSDTIDEAIKLTKRSKRPPTMEEIVGAWGELYLLLQLVSECSDHDKQLKVIGGWEGSEEADNRPHHPRTSIGNRSEDVPGRGPCTSHQRLQPDNDSNGLQVRLLASLSVVENDEGLTCSSLVSSIRSSLVGSGSSVTKPTHCLTRGCE